MKQLSLIPLLILFVFTCAVVALLIGPTELSAPGFIAAIFGRGEIGDRIVIWEIRAPRMLAALIVGAALGASGAALQGLLRNPLAEPGILGVSASASLAATFCIFFGLVGLTPLVVPLASITGALAATFVITFIAFRVRSVSTLILAGIGLSSFAGGLMALLMNFAPNPFSLSDMMNWTLGSVANRSFSEIILLAPFFLIGAGLLLVTRRGLSALTLGEEAARGVGLDIRRQRIMVVLGSGILSGAAVALAGAIGFVGIVAPHIVRPFVGYDPARTLLPSALLGGGMLILADIFVRILPSTNELKLGVLAALIGAPIFIWIALQRRGPHG